MTLSGELVELISSNCSFICITGGGGKTSLMQLLAKEYRAAGKKVLMTTTTKVQSPEVYSWNCDCIFTNKDGILKFKPESPCTVLYAERIENPDKLKAPDLEALKELKDKFDVVLCEADGSRQMPVKWHTDRDPVVPDFCTYTISVMGAWGQVDSMQEYIDSPQGLLKASLKNRRAVLVNGETCTIIFSNIQWPKDCAIIFGSVKNNESYRRS